MDVTNNHSTEADTDSAVELAQDPSDYIASDRELQLEILRLARETHESQLATQAMVEGVIAEVGPMVESFANNPALKMLGFGKVFGK